MTVSENRISFLLSCGVVMEPWQNCQLTDVTRATLDLWEAEKSKNTPAIVVTRNL